MTALIDQQAKLKKLQNKEGVINTSQAIRAGVHPRTLYQLRDNGVLEQLSRGLYRFTDSDELSFPDLVTVAAKKPNAVICLISALSFHGLTTQIPHSVDIALLKGDIAPRLDYPPITVYHFSESTFNSGVNVYSLDGVRVKIFCKEKTIADCVKFRNKIGMDVVLEALKEYCSSDSFNLELLLEYASICRVKRIITPYLEAIL